MSPGATPPVTICVRDLQSTDADDLVAIDGLHTGQRKPEYWQRVIHEGLQPNDRALRVGLVATATDGGVVAYLLAEVRAFEFGSPPCGWIFAVGVRPGELREGVGSALLREACARFRQAGIDRVRTMVQRTDISVLSFFRANGFEGGSFVQLELDLEESS